jgi:protein arginine N-methyltransferase 3
MDFYSRIKMINYIRTLTAAGKPFDPADQGFNDDKFMQPVLEDDPLLFSLDEEQGDEPEYQMSPHETTTEDLQAKLRDLELQFQEYKQAVGKHFAKQLEEKSTTFEATVAKNEEEEEPRDDDSHYFNSYAGNCWVSSVFKLMV